MPEHPSPIEDRLLALASHVSLGTATDHVDAVLTRLGASTASAPELATGGKAGDEAGDPVVPLDRRRRTRSGTPRSLRWAAAVVLVAVTGGVAAIGPAREAVAGWLGVDGVTIEVIDRLPAGLPDRFDLRALGEPTTLSVAQQAVSFPIRVPAGFGPPDAYVDHPPGGVTLAWPEERVVLTEHPGDVYAIAKGAPPGTTVEPVTVEGQPGFWITGDHLVAEPAPPGGTAPPPRLTGNALVWSVDGVVHRLEVDTPLADARTLATTLR